MTLHIISASPFTHNALQSCLVLLHEDDALLLICDGVYGLQTNTLPKENVYFLEGDRTARALPEPANAKGINYLEMVKLTEQHSPIQTWR